MQLLVLMAGALSISYTEANVIVYFILIPAVFALLLDRIFQTKAFRLTLGIAVIVALAISPNAAVLSDMLFSGSVRFLESFAAVGIDYVSASVWICVVLPSAVFLALVSWSLARKTKKTAQPLEETGK